jgi:hypothetical protein
MQAAEFLTSVPEIESATDDFPLLGYTVIASLGGVEVAHDDLRQTLTSLGLQVYLPGLPEPRTALRRAMRAWLQGLADTHDDALDPGAEDDDRDRHTRQLIREIPGARLLTLALVAENVDLAHLGLSYLTNLRVFYDRSTRELHLTTTPVGQPDPLQLGTGRTPRDEWLLTRLRPFWERYRELHTGADLGRMVQAIIAAMQATSLRPAGGVSFVPYLQRPALQCLKQLIENGLPAAPGQTSSSTLLHLPVVDRPAVRAHMARAIHSALLGEVTTLQKDLDRIVQQTRAETHVGRPTALRQSTVMNRLTQYRALRSKIELYGEILGARQQQALAALASLQLTARSLLDAATGPEPKEVADPGSGPGQEPDGRLVAVHPKLPAAD